MQRVPGLVVGIGGGSPSGKTTLTGALKSQLGDRGLSVSHLVLDAFFHPSDGPGPKVTLPTTGETLADRNHPESADVTALLAQIDASVQSDDVVLVEGHLVLGLPDVRERMHLKVFIDLDADERALRRLLRDRTGGRGNADPAWIAEYFLVCAKPGHEKYIEPTRREADLIVRGDRPVERSAMLLASIVVALRSDPS